MVVAADIVEQVVDTFRRAAEANRSTPARDGNVVVLDADAGDEVMITADLHGHRLNFERLLKVADLAGHPGRHLVVQEVCHGGPTYPGGGCMSHLLLEDVARLKTDLPERFHFLLSNHELAELTDFPIMKQQQVLNLVFRCGLQEMYGESTERVREAYCEFIASCPLALRLSASRALVTHSLPKQVDELGFDVTVFERPLQPSDFTIDGDVFRLVWGRDFRPENVAAFGRLVDAELFVTGHEPCTAGYSVPNERQVILDCCGERACYALLPLDRKLSQREIVERIKELS